ncbi:MAG: nitroreductase family deazaflavin-dependent oxidoreductase [Anaerolineales bacterium]|nr:nitroreductase family deazaflavin-dependent oxidoreductase [Anaerolineales bacterium]
MDTISTQTDDAYRQAFKRFNIIMLWLWRLGFRRWVNFWPSVAGRIMVITHTGRKSGLRRRTPVNYVRIGGDLYCTAGFGHVSDWYRNIMANPNVEVWLPDSWLVGTAEDISDHERRIPLLREVIIASGFAGPMFGVNPHTMSDQEFAAATKEYRLIRIQLTQQLGGPGGPGDLAWVWTPILLALALIVFLPRLMNRIDSK